MDDFNEKDFNEKAFADQFRQSLKDVREAYLKRSETGERAAYIAAIRAISLALWWARIDDEPVVPGDEGKKCSLWFKELANQLKDLDGGIVSAALDCPVRKKGLSSSVWMDRSMAVVQVELLHCQCGMKYEDAARHVISNWAKTDEKLTALKVSEKELLSWLGEFRKGRVADRAAVENYEAIANFSRRLQSSLRKLQQGGKN
jgi:hypothetical protein